MNNNIIDLKEIDKKMKMLATKDEFDFRKNQINSLIDTAGLRGFFSGQKTPIPNGIVLDYNIEEVQKEIGGAS